MADDTAPRSSINIWIDAEGGHTELDIADADRLILVKQLRELADDLANLPAEGDEYFQRHPVH